MRTIFRSKLMFPVISLAILLAVWFWFCASRLMNSRLPPSQNEKAVLKAGKAGTSTQPGAREKDPLHGILASPPTPADPAIAGLAVASKPLHDRISGFVDELKAESLLDSVANLSRQKMFMWPGTFHPTVLLAIPVPQEYDRVDVETIMSCRRFLKVVEELSGISKQEAAGIVSNQINTSLAKYIEVYKAEWNALLANRRSKPQTRSAVIGFIMTYSDSPDGSPTLWGLRLQLLSLTLAAGNLELVSAKPAVLSVVNESYRQREVLYAEGDIGLGDRASVLRTSSLYNRQILATGILGTSGKNPGTRSIAKDNGWGERRLTKYDATDTPYDLGTRANGPIPPDFSRGEIFVKFRRPLNDEDFDRLVKEAKEP
jgi:hypothetical protein